MYTIGFFVAVITLSCVTAAPKPTLLAAPYVAAAPAVAPAFVTAQSSQVIARNFNGIAAPLVAAPYVAAPYVAAPYATPYVAGPAPLVASTAPYLGAPLVARAPLVAAPGGVVL